MPHQKAASDPPESHRPQNTEGAADEPWRQLDGLSLEQVLYKTDHFTAYKAKNASSPAEVRLTLFSPDVSSSSSFRAAFRKDQPNLSHINHDNVLKPLTWGECNGQLYYVTEYPEGVPLSQLLSAQQSLEWDECLDIGWQIASALQHAHNLGIAHGGLSLTSVSITKDIRCKVMGFGLYRWLNDASLADQNSKTDPTSTEASWTQLAISDLVDFGGILDSLCNYCHPDTPKAHETRQIKQLQKLIEQLKSPPPDLTARDVQGRLGNILLQAGGDEIDIVDDRKGQQLSRRSIVDELFDSPGLPAMSAEHVQVTQKTARGIGWKIMAALTAIVLILLAILFLSPG